MYYTNRPQTRLIFERIYKIFLFFFKENKKICSFLFPLSHPKNENLNLIYFFNTTLYFEWHCLPCTLKEGNLGKRKRQKVKMLHVVESPNSLAWSIEASSSLYFTMITLFVLCKTVKVETAVKGSGSIFLVQ